MISDPGLEGISHILVDEVHERSVEMDLLLLLLKENVKQLPNCHKIVLMSATANAKDFSTYFSSVVSGGKRLCLFGVAPCKWSPSLYFLSAAVV